MLVFVRPIVCLMKSDPMVFVRASVCLMRSGPRPVAVRPSVCCIMSGVMFVVVRARPPLAVAESTFGEVPNKLLPGVPG